MKISINRCYQNAKVTDGFRPVEFTDADEFADLVSWDHCPAILEGGIRKNDNFISSDFLWLDFDDGLSIAEFRALQDFTDIFYIIYTSRNHQKTKNDIPPCDRFHVLFPVETITTRVELDRRIGELIAKTPQADKGAKGASRLLFGNKDAIVIWHDGKPLSDSIEEKSNPSIEFDDDLPYETPPEIKHTKPKKLLDDYTQKNPVDFTDDSKKADTLELIRQGANSGLFDEYSEWVKVGMAMYKEGYSFSDWLNCSHPGQDAIALKKKWESFAGTSQLSGGTLVHYARLIDPTFLQKGSLIAPIGGKIRIGNGTTIAKAESSEDSGGISSVYVSDAPGQLERVLDESEVSEMWEKLTRVVQHKNEPARRILDDDWIETLIQNDREVRNCAKLDYTVGSPHIAYPNTTILKTAIFRRCRCYGVPVKAITERAINLIYERVMHLNRDYNRVLSFMEMLKWRYRNEKLNTDELIDQFIAMMEFEDVFGMDKKVVIKMYRETFHLFYLKMHLHILGTKKDKNGDYYGLIPNDIVPVLGGKQNIGKTTLCQWIFPNREDMYVDLGSGGKGSFGSDNTERQIRGKGIAEIGEMKVMRDASNVESVKSLVSKTKYDMNIKYVEYAESLPSTVSFMGTSNPKEYLSDITGNRRFFPIDLVSINKEALAKSLELAEKLHAAYAILAAEVPKEMRHIVCTPSAELHEFMERNRDNAMIVYADHEAVREVVEIEFEKAFMEKTRADAVHGIRLDKIIKLVGLENPFIKITHNSIQKVLQDMGYEKNLYKDDGKMVRGWVKRLR